MKENEENLISIIIPFYNAENYLSKCMESILNQSYSNFEVIAVNDGSIDETGNMLVKYAEKDCRIHYYQQKNSGRSMARNFGIKHCRGKYITFIDSDDYVSRYYLEHLLLGIKNGSDISMVNKILVDSLGCRLDKKKYSYRKKIFENIDGMKTVLNQHPDNEVWGKLFKRKIFHGVHFPEGKIYEDLYLTYILLAKAKKIYFYDSPDYFYVQRSDNTMNSKFSKKNMDILFIGNKLEKELLNIYPNLKKNIECRLFAAYSNVWMKIPRKEFEDDYDKLWFQIKEKRNFLLLKGISNKNIFFGVYASLFGPTLYRKIYSIFKEK